MSYNLNRKAAPRVSSPNAFAPATRFSGPGGGVDGPSDQPVFAFFLVVKNAPNCTSSYAGKTKTLSKTLVNTSPLINGGFSSESYECQETYI